MGKPRLLIFSPVLPSISGQGSAMRINNVINVYSEKYDIFLLVINWGFRNKNFSLSSIENCENVEYIPLYIGNLFKKLLFKFSKTIFYLVFRRPKEWQFNTSWQSKSIYQKFINLKIDKIYIFRLYMAPFAKHFINEDFKGKIILDLDDVESETRNNFAEIAFKKKNIKYSLDLLKDAKYYVNEEILWLPKFDSVFVCNDLDKNMLESKYSLSNVKILPNVVSMPSISKENSDNKIFTFLFVGVLDYFPNEDGIHYFCEKIFPILKANANEDFEVRFVGNGNKEGLQNKYRNINELKFVGYVDNVEKSYLSSNAVIVPLRAGGGTRIKVLEALSYRKPTIATSKGAEGIQVVHDKHLLIADKSAEFSSCCLDVMRNHELRNRLSENGFQLIKDKYTINQLPSILLG